MCNYVELDDCPFGQQQIGNDCVPCNQAQAANAANPNRGKWMDNLGDWLNGVSSVIDSVKGNPGNAESGQAGQIVIQQPPATNSNNNTVIIVMAVLVVVVILAVFAMRNKGKA